MGQKRVSFLVYNCFILKFFFLKITLVCYNLIAEGPGSMFAGENFKYLGGLKWIDSAQNGQEVEMDPPHSCPLGFAVQFEALPSTRGACKVSKSTK